MKYKVPASFIVFLLIGTCAVAFFMLRPPSYYYKDEKRAALKLAVEGIITRVGQIHDYVLYIQTDTGVVVNTSADPDLVREMQIGDSIYKSTGDPYCYVVRSGDTVGRYWYDGVLGDSDLENGALD